MTTPIQLAISTCPNDTFAFHGLLSRSVDLRGLEFSVQLLDIQQLNTKLLHGEFDITKASYHAALKVASDITVLPNGSALGFGVGPLLLAAQPDILPTGDPEHRTLCPGEETTATMLMKLFYPNERIDQTLFSDIMPHLQQGQAEFGVCIHEGRFTWQRQGLAMVADLGQLWEQETQCPLPLGGVFASRRLPVEVAVKVQQVLADSLELALEAPELTLPTMRKYAQEFDDKTLMQHVDLYVNDWTVELGTTGRAALSELARLAKQVRLIDDESERLVVLAG